jgi:hypothetical protein
MSHKNYINPVHLNCRRKKVKISRIYIWAKFYVQRLMQSFLQDVRHPT